MEYTLTIISINPTTALNTERVALSVSFTLSGSGVSLPGYSIDLYDAMIGGNMVKSLYYDDMNDLSSGYALPVSFSGVSPGNYYVEVFYRVIGTPRKLITITGSSSGTNNIDLNSSDITANTLNGSNVTLETLNGSVVYGS